MRVAAFSSVFLCFGRSLGFSGARSRQILRPPHFRHQRAAYVPAPRAAKDPYDNKEIEASVKRGEALFAATFVACAWFLSVPVEIRRTPICPTKFALEKRIGGDLKDWASLVSTHYSTCSEKKTCVVWDFSIDPKTLEKNGFAPTTNTPLDAT